MVALTRYRVPRGTRACRRTSLIGLLCIITWLWSPPFMAGYQRMTIPRPLQGNLARMTNAEQPFSLRWEDRVQSTTAYFANSLRTKVLQSRMHPRGYVNWFKTDGFNAAILPMPPGSRYPYFVVERDPQVWKKGGDHGTYVVMGLSGYFAKTSRDKMIGLTLLKSTTTRPIRIKLPSNLTLGERWCSEQAFEIVTGPEDPRLHWSQDMTPTLTFTQSLRGIYGKCRQVHLVDVRSLHSTFRQEFEAVTSIDLPPIITRRPVMLSFAGVHEIEKNWAHIPDPLYTNLHVFQANVLKNRMFAYRPEPLSFFTRTSTHAVDDRIQNYTNAVELHGLNMPTENYDDSPTKARGLDDLVLETDSTIPKCFSDILLTGAKIHHATNFVRVTLCDRGQCRPSEKRTVLVGIMHFKHGSVVDMMIYEKRLVLMESVAPYRYLRVSKSLSLLGLPDAPEFQFAIGLTLIPKIKGGALELQDGGNAAEVGEMEIPRPADRRWHPSDGYLDDGYIISGGLSDRKSWFMDGLVGDLVGDLGSFYRC